MNLTEIINRDSRYLIQQDEALYVIQQYIIKRKGINVNPKVHIFRMNTELPIMCKMMLHAIGWFRMNPE